jgi:hypothetical protein
MIQKLNVGYTLAFLKFLLLPSPFVRVIALALRLSYQHHGNYCKNSPTITPN